MELTKKGADRQKMHERLRQHALQAWAEVQKGEPNPLVDLILEDEVLRTFLSRETIREVMESEGYVGDAPQRAMKLVSQVRSELSDRET
jgi:adenylosuccinate lyase